MPSCAVKSCKNYASKSKKPDGITYHIFPKHAKRKEDWVLIIRNCRGDSNWNPSNSTTVCSAHFDEDDFVTTAKGLRCLVPYAIPKRFLSKPETETQSHSSHILQKSPNAKGVASDQQPPSSSPSTVSSLLSEPALTDEFALTGYCRLCAASKCDGMVVNIQSDDALKKIVVNMSNRLNINIDFNQEHFPTTICSVCVKSLYTAYDFVVGIDLAQMTLNKISMQKYKYQKPEIKKEIINQLGNNMDLPSSSLQQLSPNIGTAESHFEQSLPFISEETTRIPQISLNTGTATSNLDQLPLLDTHPTMPFLVESPRNRRLQDHLDKKKQIIESQRKNLKRLNQKVRRLQNRNESLKNVLKNLKEKNDVGTDLYNTFNENIAAVDLLTCEVEKGTDLDNNTLNEDSVDADIFTCKAEKGTDLDNTLNEDSVDADIFTCKAEKGTDLDNTLNEDSVDADMFTCKSEKGTDLDNTLNEDSVDADMFTCKSEKGTDLDNTLNEDSVDADMFTCKSEKGTDLDNTFNEDSVDADIFTCKSEKEW